MLCDLINLFPSLTVKVSESLLCSVLFSSEVSSFGFERFSTLFELCYCCFNGSDILLDCSLGEKSARIYMVVDELGTHDILIVFSGIELYCRFSQAGFKVNYGPFDLCKIFLAFILCL